MGANLLGGVFSAFGKNERKTSWDKNPLTQQYEAQAANAFRRNQDYAQSQANLGSFLDSKKNMTALNAGMGNLMQSGGAYGGQQLRAVSAQNAANKAQNYDSTLQGQAQAGQMRTAAQNQYTGDLMAGTTNYQMNEQYEPDFMARLGSTLSGANNALTNGMDSANTMRNQMSQMGNGQVPSQLGFLQQHMNRMGVSSPLGLIGRLR